MNTQAWVSAYAELKGEWRSVVGRPRAERSVEDWPRLFQHFQAEQRRLMGGGRWVSGYSDLWHVAEVADLEAYHSNTVKWLLDPAGRHGLRDRLVRAILEAGWGPSDEVATEAALVVREVPEGSRRADIVVYMGPTTLVIENKVGAPESPWQCEDLYQIWFSPGADARFLFLTPDGHPPRETKTQAAADAWRSLSYPSLANWLEENLPTLPQSLAQKTVEQYVATIRETYRGTRPFQIRVGGGNVDE